MLPVLLSLLAAQQPIDPQLAKVHILEPPCPVEGAQFGQSVTILDLDGDGFLDVATGASGEGMVYVFRGRAAGAKKPFGPARLFSSQGPEQCPAPYSDDLFGWDVWGAQLDGDAADELIVGAPHEDVAGVANVGAAYLIGYGPSGAIPVRLASPALDPGSFGSSVVGGDFNGDGLGDVAIGARLAAHGSSGEVAGRVYVWFGPVDPSAAPLVIENPNPVLFGNLGHHIAVGDTNGDGQDDLVVNAIGNGAAGVPVAGQVFVFEAPLGSVPTHTIEDPSPDPLDLPGPRYGMGIDARGPWVAVGANRKDIAGLHDPGRGFTQSGPTFTDVVFHDHPSPKASDYLGFRCAIADVIGDSALDFSFIAMPKVNGADPNPRAILTWDGNARFGPPARIRLAIPGSQDHYANGLDRGDLFPGGKEEIVLGDMSYDRPGLGTSDNSGRVVIYSY